MRMNSFGAETVKNPESPFDKTKAILEQYTTKMKDFIDVYSREEIISDIQQVKKFEADYTLRNKDSKERNKSRTLGKMFEAMMYEQIEASDWMGADSTSILTSAYDDDFNGTDSVIEFGEPDEKGKVATLAVDVTMSTRSISGKFARIQNELRAGTMTSLKYLQSERSSNKGSASYIPRVVIGIGGAEVSNILEKWTFSKQALADHPIQLLIIEQTLIQLLEYKTYLDKLIPQNDKHYTEARKKGLENVKVLVDIFTELKKTKLQQIPEGLSPLADDPILYEIKQQMAALNTAQV